MNSSKTQVHRFPQNETSLLILKVNSRPNYHMRRWRHHNSNVFCAKFLWVNGCFYNVISRKTSFILCRFPFFMICTSDQKRTKYIASIGSPIDGCNGQQLNICWPFSTQPYFSFQYFLLTDFLIRFTIRTEHIHNGLFHILSVVV